MLSVLDFFPTDLGFNIYKFNEHEKVINLYKKIFGKENFTIYSYDYINYYDDLFSHFVKNVLKKVSLSEHKSEIINKSFDYKLIELLRLSNKIYKLKKNKIPNLIFRKFFLDNYKVLRSHNDFDKILSELDFVEFDLSHLYSSSVYLDNLFKLEKKIDLPLLDISNFCSQHYSKKFLFSKSTSSPKSNIVHFLDIILKKFEWSNIA